MPMDGVHTALSEEGGGVEPSWTEHVTFETRQNCKFWNPPNWILEPRNIQRPPFSMLFSRESPFFNWGWWWQVIIPWTRGPVRPSTKNPDQPYHRGDLRRVFILYSFSFVFFLFLSCFHGKGTNASTCKTNDATPWRQRCKFLFWWHVPLKLPLGSRDMGFPPFISFIFCHILEAYWEGNVFLFPMLPPGPYARGGGGRAWNIVSLFRLPTLQRTSVLFHNCMCIFFLLHLGSAFPFLFCLPTPKRFASPLHGMRLSLCLQGRRGLLCAVFFFLFRVACSMRHARF